MSALAGLQREFARAIEHGDDGVARRVRGTRAAARVAFYRAGVRAQHRDALAATYPVVRRLVGDEFFGEMARRYALAHPSRSGDLALFGDRFGEFLAADRDAAALPYLADMARLEWACHESFHAPDAPALDAIALAAVEPRSRGLVRLALHPSVRLVDSAHPVAAIREANQPDRDGTPARREGPDRVLVHRHRGGVRVRCVADEGEWGLLLALHERRTLDEVVQSMGAVAERCLGDGLARLAGDGAIAGFSVDADAG